MISSIVTAAIIWCMFAGLDALFRKKSRPMTSAEMEAIVVKDAAARLGVSEVRFREMLAEEMETMRPRRPRRNPPHLRVVK